MQIPYIKIYQKNEMFFISKFKLSELKRLVTFHFRHDQKKHSNINDVDEYINKLKKKGLELQSSEEGIQRRLEVKRINDIKTFFEDSTNVIFPTTVILSCDIKMDSPFYTKHLTEDSPEIGYLDFDPQIHSLRIIDGQHRLAGMFIANEANTDNLEVSTTILFNIGLATEAKLFADINGKQKAVNKSLVYDLYEEIGESEVNNIFKYHNICKNLNSEIKSPLYKQIKMLGTGKGAISQAFMIDYLEEVEKKNLLDLTAEKLYEQLFLYFKAFQVVFPEDWPVPENLYELEEYSHNVLNIRKSQLVKTNGFGAILQLFPKIYNGVSKNFQEYLQIIMQLQNKIDWQSAEGTGRTYQKKYLMEMEDILNL